MLKYSNATVKSFHVNNLQAASRIWLHDYLHNINYVTHPLFGVLSSQAGIPLRYPTQSFDYGGGLVSVQVLNCHLWLNHFYILRSGQIVVIFDVWGRKGSVSPNIFQVRPNLLSCEAVPSETLYYHTPSVKGGSTAAAVGALWHPLFIFAWARSCLDYCAISDRYGWLPWSTAVEV